MRPLGSRLKPPVHRQLGARLQSKAMRAPIVPDDAPTADAGTSTFRAIRARLLVVAAAVLSGLLLPGVLTRHLAAVEGAAKLDPVGARRQLANELRVGGLALFATTGALGVWLMALSARARRVGSFPPPGTSLWLAARRRVTGFGARRMATAGLALGALLVGAAIAGGAVAWRMAAALLACRAR